MALHDGGLFDIEVALSGVQGLVVVYM